MKRILYVVCFLMMILSSLTVIAQAKTDTLKVMTFNILQGATTQGDFNLDAIAGFINKHQPDLVALQEVDVHTNRAKKYNLPLELGYRTKMMPFYAKAMNYDDGEYGEAILSKFSVVYSKNIALPHLPTSEPRAAQVIQFTTKSGNTFQFVATHLDHLKNETDRLMQAKALVNQFKDTKYPTILAGDLNATPNSETMKLLYQVFTKPNNKEAFKPTWPSTRTPEVCIDHILYNRPNNWKVLNYKVVCDDYITDHCVVIATLIYTP